MSYTLGSNGYVTRTEDGAAIPPDSANADYREYLSWVAAGNTASAHVQASLRQIASLSFRKRFPSQEMAAITVAAAQYSAAGHPELQILIDNLSAARFVDLDAGETQAGVASLLGLNLITQGTADALLANGTVQEL